MAVAERRARLRAPSSRGRPYDLLVIGSGIIGAGIANEAARAGLRVALVDRERLRRRHVERLVEADPRRPALPPARRREARPRGAHGAAGAAPCRRAAPRRGGSRSCSRSTAAAPTGPRRSRRGCGRTPRSRARSSADSSRPERARRSVPAAPARRTARLRRLPGRVDSRRAALPRERDGRRGGGRDGAQLRGGRRAANGRRPGRGRRDPRPPLRRGRLGRGAGGRQRDRAVARHLAPAGGRRGRAVRPALEGRARDPAAATSPGRPR